MDCGAVRFSLQKEEAFVVSSVHQVQAAPGTRPFRLFFVLEKRHSETLDMKLRSVDEEELCILVNTILIIIDNKSEREGVVVQRHPSSFLI